MSEDRETTDPDDLVGGGGERVGGGMLCDAGMVCWEGGGWALRVRGEGGGWAWVSGEGGGWACVEGEGGGASSCSRRQES